MPETPKKPVIDSIPAFVNEAVEVDGQAVTFTTKLNIVDAEFILGACLERQQNPADFLREAAIEWASH